MTEIIFRPNMPVITFAVPVLDFECPIIRVVQARQ